MTKSIIVTGGAGFIGANFVRYWRRAHPQTAITVLDRLTYAGNRSSLADLEGQPGFDFVEGDVCDTDLVEVLLRDRDADTLMHFAAESHVDRSISGPDAFIETNIIGTHSLLKAARKVWAARKDVRFHHVSTDEVYGSLGPSDPAFREDTAYAPNSPYAASKAASDHLVRAYHHTYGLPTITTNCSNNYGPYQYPEKLLPLMIVNCLAGLSLPVYGDGQNVRDWLYVEDHCRGIEAALVNGEPGECYNVGGNNEQRNIDLIHLICTTVDTRFAQRSELCDRFPDAPAARGGTSADLITHVPDRLGHDRRYAVDASRLEGAFGFAPRETMSSGLARTVDWYLDNEDWWGPLLGESYHKWIQRNYAARQSE